MTETDLQVLLDRVAAELRAAVTLCDAQLLMFVHTAHDNVSIDEAGRAWIVDRRPPAKVLAWFEDLHLREADAPVRMPVSATIGVSLERWCIPVRFREVLFGYMFVLDDGRFQEGDLGPALEVANQIGAHFYRRRLLAQVDSGLLRLLVVPGAENEVVAAEARALGTYVHDGPVTVIVAGASNGDELSLAGLFDVMRAAQRAAELSSSEGVLAGVIAKRVVMLTPLRRIDDIEPARRLVDNMRFGIAQTSPDLDVAAAIGGATELEHASHSYAQARRAFRVLAAVPHLGPVVTWDGLGAFRALALLPVDDIDEIENGVLDARVRALLSDEALVVTAETFLDLAGNVHETAKALFVHRATLYQRLDRIAALFQLDLRRNGDHRLIAHVGLKLARVAHL